MSLMGLNSVKGDTAARYKCISTTLDHVEVVVPARQPLVQQAAGRLLRGADSAAAARVVPDARGARRPGEPVRQERDGGRREGAARQRPRREPVERRQHDPALARGQVSRR